MSVIVNNEGLVKYQICSIIDCGELVRESDEGKWVKSTLSDIYEQYCTFICNKCLGEK